jgi:hypothetical protein
LNGASEKYETPLRKPQFVLDSMKKREWHRKILQEIMAENMPELITNMNLHIQETE